MIRKFTKEQRDGLQAAVSDLVGRFGYSTVLEAVVKDMRRKDLPLVLAHLWAPWAWALSAVVQNMRANTRDFNRDLTKRNRQRREKQAVRAAAQAAVGAWAKEVRESL